MVPENFLSSLQWRWNTSVRRFQKSFEYQWCKLEANM